MKKIQLLNTSEYKTNQTLQRVLNGTRFRVVPQLPLNKVLQGESADKLSKAENNFLQKSELDFVIYDEKSIPQLAIEFDGPAHQYPDQIKRDVMKNRLCHKAELPLLRINDNYLAEYAKTSLLEYILIRYVSWDKEKDEIDTEIDSELSQKSDDEIENLIKGGIADPSIDPTFRFDLRHPFPGTKETATRLKAKYGIISPYITFDEWKEAANQDRILELSIGGWQIGRHRQALEATKEYNLEEVIKVESQLTRRTLNSFQTTFGIPSWQLLVDDYDWKETPILYKLRTGNWPLAQQSIPGITTWELVENACEFLALQAVEEWVEINLDISVPNFL